MSAHGREKISLANNPNFAVLQAALSGEFTAFTVFRKLGPDSEPGVEDLLADLPCELAVATNLTVGAGYRNSHVTSSHGQRLARPWAGRFNELRERVEDTIETFPDSVQGFIGKACIFRGGSKDEKRGLKYVTLTFDDEASIPLEAEHMKLRKAVGGSPLPKANRVPHITVAKTEDLREAKKIKLHLNRRLSGLSEDERIPVLFGVAQLDCKKLR